MVWVPRFYYRDSPVSNDGCGLKHRERGTANQLVRDSPVSNDGCGLKQEFDILFEDRHVRIHPSAMTGVD